MRRRGRTRTGAATIRTHAARTENGKNSREEAARLAQNSRRRVGNRIAGLNRSDAQRHRSYEARDRRWFDGAGWRPAEALRRDARLHARLRAVRKSQSQASGLSDSDAGRKAQAPEAHSCCNAAHPAFDSADAVHRRVLFRRQKVLLHFAAHPAGMYAAVPPHFRGQKAAGA